MTRIQKDCDAGIVKNKLYRPQHQQHGRTLDVTPKHAMAVYGSGDLSLRRGFTVSATPAIPATLQVYRIGDVGSRTNSTLTFSAVGNLAQVQTYHLPVPLAIAAGSYSAWFEPRSNDLRLDCETLWGQDVTTDLPGFIRDDETSKVEAPVRAQQQDVIDMIDGCPLIFAPQVVLLESTDPLAVHGIGLSVELWLPCTAEMRVTLPNPPIIVEHALPVAAIADNDFWPRLTNMRDSLGVAIDPRATISVAEAPVKLVKSRQSGTSSSKALALHP